MSDAIVLSTWSWDVFNVPERIALALASRGSRVLYCEMPVSRFRKRAKETGEIEKNVYGFRPEYFGEKFSAVPSLRRIQWRSVARQILELSRRLGLRDPVFLCSHIRHVEPLYEYMKGHGIPMVHICMDYPETYQYRQMELSDRTLVIPKTVGHKLKARFKEKISIIPQSIHIAHPQGSHAGEGKRHPFVAALRRPLLGYVGPLHGRLNIDLLKTVLRTHPEWEFVAFGGANSVGTSNCQDIAWVQSHEIPSLVRSFDVGVMPYDCFDDRNLHCVPLKLFDYFLAGIPVVATPVISLWEYKDLIYFGDTAHEFAEAVQRALEEPASSEKRGRRIEVAKAHSTERLGESLALSLNFAARPPE